MSHSSALRFRRSERTTGTCRLRSNCLRTCSGFCPTRSATAANSASRSSSVDLDLLGLGDGPQGEVDLDRLRWRSPAARRRTPPGPARSPRGTARGRAPWAWRRIARSWSRCCISALTRASGTSSLDQLGEGLGRLLLQRHLALHLLDDAEPLGQVGAQLVDGLELGRLRGPLVVGLGQHLLLDVLDEDPEVDRVLVGIGVVGGELEDVADLRAPGAARRARARRCRCRPRRGSRRR